MGNVYSLSRYECIFENNENENSIFRIFYALDAKIYIINRQYQTSVGTTSTGGFIKGILIGVRCTKSLRVLFLHRRPPSGTTLVLYSRAVFIFNEPALHMHSSSTVLYMLFL
jgi:hypothetical protein